MAHKDRKTHKFRGSRNCGFGTQKHRGAGSRGGRGMAGSKTHKWSYISKYIPGYLGGKGFKRPLKILRDVNTINVGELDKDLDQLVDKGMVELRNNKYSINLKEMGFDKLLGSGSVTKPMEIKVDKSSRLAVQKIEDAGGKVELLSTHQLSPPHQEETGK